MNLSLRVCFVPGKTREEFRCVVPVLNIRNGRESIVELSFTSAVERGPSHIFSLKISCYFTSFSHAPFRCIQTLAVLSPYRLSVSFCSFRFHCVANERPPLQTVSVIFLALVNHSDPLPCCRMPHLRGSASPDLCVFPTFHPAVVCRIHELS